MRIGLANFVASHGANTWETLRETSCNGANHCKYVLAWLSSSPAQGQRVEYSRFLDGRILRLDLESDKNEIKSMLFDFVHDKGVNKNSFRSILDCLRELEHKNVKVVLGLAVLKSLAEAESNNEPIRQKAKKLKTMRDIQSLIASRRESWKIHMNTVSASGKVQLVVQLVEPFICRTIGAFPTSPDESSDCEDSDSTEAGVQQLVFRRPETRVFCIFFSGRTKVKIVVRRITSGNLIKFT
jgi:hypothetical protein